MVSIESTPYTVRMFETMFGLILALAAIYFWQNALKTRDLARLLAHDLCAKAGVQLLDQSIALSGFGFTRNDAGRLSLRRSYAFEVSLDGHDRHRGGLQMLDGRLLSWSLPVTHSQPLANDTNVIVMRRPEPPRSLN
jgi:Protein of unknown function (DUF3301)